GALRNRKAAFLVGVVRRRERAESARVTDQRLFPATDCRLAQALQHGDHRHSAGERIRRWTRDSLLGRAGAGGRSVRLDAAPGHEGDAAAHGRLAIEDRRGGHQRLLTHAATTMHLLTVGMVAALSVLALPPTAASLYLLALTVLSARLPQPGKSA